MDGYLILDIDSFALVVAAATWNKDSRLLATSTGCSNHNLEKYKFFFKIVSFFLRGVMKRSVKIRTNLYSNFIVKCPTEKRKKKLKNQMFWILKDLIPNSAQKIQKSNLNGKSKFSCGKLGKNKLRRWIFFFFKLF